MQPDVALAFTINSVLTFNIDGLIRFNNILLANWTYLRLVVFVFFGLAGGVLSEGRSRLLLLVGVAIKLPTKTVVYSN